MDPLLQVRRRQAKWRLRAGTAWEDWGLIFTDEIGRPIDQYRLRRSFYRLLKEAGLPRVNLYSLRRTMASIMHALRIPAKVIAERMGHAGTQVLFDYYIKVFDAQEREATEALGAALRGQHVTRNVTRRGQSRSERA